MGRHVPSRPVAVRWSNGQVDTAATWEELLEVVRADQFRDYPEDEFRRVLAKRAWRWSRWPVNPDLPAELLFQELAMAKLIVFVYDDEKGDK